MTKVEKILGVAAVVSLIVVMMEVPPVLGLGAFAIISALIWMAPDSRHPITITVEPLYDLDKVALGEDPDFSRAEQRRKQIAGDPANNTPELHRIGNALQRGQAHRQREEDEN